jgi:simple sugar transport system permease protein
VVGPLAVAAAALGGGLWGAIPGFLKARFGSSEVINTIMLNYVASSLLVFLIGSNQASFFGSTVALPFKAPGGEAKSLELGEGARLGSLVGLLGLRSGENAVSLALPLALAGLGLGLALFRGPLRRRLGPALGLGLLGLVAGLLLRG